MDNAEFSFTAAVRGFHYYRRVWVPHIGQHLCVEIEQGNPEDRFAIAVRKHDDIGVGDDRPVVGHLPRELSKVLWYFLVHGGVLELHVYDLFTFYLMPNDPVNNYF